jgi:hypothetical protein
MAADFSRAALDEVDLRGPWLARHLGIEVRDRQPPAQRAPGRLRFVHDQRQIPDVRSEWH